MSSPVPMTDVLDERRMGAQRGSERNAPRRVQRHLLGAAQEETLDPAGTSVTVAARGQSCREREVLLGGEHVEAVVETIAYDDVAGELTAELRGQGDASLGVQRVLVLAEKHAGRLRPTARFPGARDVEPPSARRML